MNKITPERQLFTTAAFLNINPRIKDSWAINMISIINENITPIEFEAAWKENPSYKLEMSVRIDGYYATALSKAIDKKNFNLTRYFIKKLSAKNIDSINYSSTRYKDLNLTPLITATFMRLINKENDDAYLEIIQQLLMAGADANLAFGQCNKDGFYPSLLTQALAISDFKLTKLLLYYGAQLQHAYTSDFKQIVKQELKNEEYKIYKLAKKSIKHMQTLFIFGNKNFESPIHSLPKEIVAYIINFTRVESSNQKKIDEARRKISNT